MGFLLCHQLFLQILKFSLLMSKKLQVPKIKKKQFVSKIMMEPYNIGKGLPPNKLPQFTEDGLILSLNPQQSPLAKLNPEGSLKINMKYDAEVITLLNRYIEVKVIDDYDDFWVGILFGLTVKGTGGQGDVRGCKVIGFQCQNILVQGFCEGGNSVWKSLQEKVNEILSNS